MQLYIGLNSERGSIKKYSFDLLEMPVSSALPKVKTLKEMRTNRPQLKFSLRLHPDVALTGGEHPDVQRARLAADALGASVIVIPTGPRFTPTTHNQTKLKAMVEKLGGEGRHVAWEPRGVWGPVESANIASSLGMLLVRDLTRQNAPEGDVIYTRLLPFGMGARIGQSAMEHLAEQLAGAETSFVIVQAEGAKRTRATLREWLELDADGASLDEGDEGDEDDDELDEAEDE